MSTRMDEEDWAHTLTVFRACLPRRGRKAEDDRRFLEALHFFTVENVRWRALPERFGHWNSIWKRFDRLSKAGVFEAFFDTLASMSSSAHLIQMFDSTIVRAHVSAAGAKGGKKRRRSTFARRLHHENPRQVGRIGRHHRLRPDRRRGRRRAAFSKPCSTSARIFSRASPSATRLRQQDQSRGGEGARHRAGHPAQGQ
jgi:transposase